MDGYVEEIDNSDNRYLIISLVNSNKKVLNRFTEVWKGISDQINNLSVKDYNELNKIRFSSDIALPLNTLIKFHALTVSIAQKFT